jgi:hypothetical protein
MHSFFFLISRHKREHVCDANRARRPIHGVCNAANVFAEQQLRTACLRSLIMGANINEYFAVLSDFFFYLTRCNGMLVIRKNKKDSITLQKKKKSAAAQSFCGDRH